MDKWGRAAVNVRCLVQFCSWSSEKQRVIVGYSHIKSTDPKVWLVINIDRMGAGCESFGSWGDSIKIRMTCLYTAFFELWNMCCNILRLHLVYCCQMRNLLWIFNSVSQIIFACVLKALFCNHLHRVWRHNPLILSASEF